MGGGKEEMEGGGHFRDVWCSESKLTKGDTENLRLRRADHLTCRRF